MADARHEPLRRCRVCRKQAPKRELMRWTVQPDDGHTVREVLARAGADGDAVSDGRVFVGRTRVRRDDASLSSRLAPIGTTRNDTSVAPASANDCSRFSIVASLPAARMSPTDRASPWSSSFW